MASGDTLTLLLSTVSLLRVTVHRIMQAIDDTRQAYRRQTHQPPPALSPIMGTLQQHFAELLKASEYLSIARAEYQHTHSGVVEAYVHEWAVSHTLGLLHALYAFLDELSGLTIPGVDLDPRLWQEGLALLEDMLDQLPEA